MRNCMLFLVLLFSTYNIFAQNIEVPQIIPTSPQSQIFEKYIDHPVAEYKGLPQIDIPLYEIKIDDITIPLSLSYHASGIKALQFDGDIAAGWTIPSSGFRISRNIKGKPDEVITNSYSHSKLQSLSGMDFELYLASLHFYSGGSEVFLKPMEPTDIGFDQFTYTLPHKSGHFIINDIKENIVSIADLSNDKIIMNNDLSEFEIIDENGNRYLFGGEDDTNRRQLVEVWPKDTSYKTSWALKKIITPKGKEIKFYYSFYRTVSRMRNVLSVIASGAEVLYSPKGERPTENYDVSTSHSRESNSDIYSTSFYLEKIETDDQVILLNRGGIDISHYKEDYEYLLSNIDIISKNNSKLIKRVILNRDLSPLNTLSTDPSLVFHRLLKSVLIEGSDTGESQVFSFKYYEPQSDVGFTYDQWGYYIPLDRQYANIAHSIDKSIQEEPVYNKTISYCMSIKDYIPSSVLLIDKTVIHPENLFSLKEITYPTGGYTEYIYEPHKYREGGRSHIGGGFRIKQIISKDANEDGIISDFEYGNDGWGSSIDIKKDIKDLYATDLYSYKYIPDPEVNPEHGLILYIGYKRNITSFSSRILVDNPDSFFDVFYSTTTKKNLDFKTKEPLGKIVSVYSQIKNMHSVAQMYRLGQHMTCNNNYGGLYIDSYSLGYKPLLLKKQYFDSTGFEVKREEYRTKVIEGKSYEGIVTRLRHQLPQGWICTPNNQLHDIFKITSLFEFGRTFYKTGTCVISGITETEFIKGGSPLKILTSYTYDDKNRLISTTVTNSVGGTKVQTHTYSASGTALVDKNMISTVVQTDTKHNNQAAGVVKTIYPTTSILPSSVQTSTTDASKLRTDLTYDLYDDKGNIRQYTTLDGSSTTYIWSYGSQYPLIEIKNAKYEDVKAAVESVFGLSIEALAAKSYLESDKNSIINKFVALQKHASLKNAMVSGYTYKPLVGISTATDPSGKTSYYEYDSFNRLKSIKDHEGNIIEEYDYNYRNK